MKQPTVVISITLNQFQVLNDVLYEIEESRDFEGKDKKALEELKEMFTYRKYVDFKKSVEVTPCNP